VIPLPHGLPGSRIRDNHARGSDCSSARPRSSRTWTLKAPITRPTYSATTGFQRRLATGLQASRSFVLPEISDQGLPTSEFELVTWLVSLAE
jgi:hypothetical protein